MLATPESSMAKPLIRRSSVLRVVPLRGSVMAMSGAIESLRERQARRSTDRTAAMTGTHGRARLFVAAYRSEDDIAAMLQRRLRAPKKPGTRLRPSEAGERVRSLNTAWA